jgi:hypothetical protein
VKEMEINNERDDKIKRLKTEKKEDDGTEKKKKDKNKESLDRYKYKKNVGFLKSGETKYLNLSVCLKTFFTLYNFNFYLFKIWNNLRTFFVCCIYLLFLI